MAIYFYFFTSTILDTLRPSFETTTPLLVLLPGTAYYYASSAVLFLLPFVGSDNSGLRSDLNGVVCGVIRTEWCAVLAGPMLPLVRALLASWVTIAWIINLC